MCHVCCSSPFGNYLRVRGEYHTGKIKPHLPWELPPRTRRIPCSILMMVKPLRTTSAYAENTPDKDVPYGQQGNYLRVRGEYTISSAIRIAESELPPRTRRIPAAEGARSGRIGTTSAYAENTLAGCSIPAPWRNYLRVRGEYANAISISWFLRELPPRTRRIRMVGNLPRWSIGTTSACAENTLNELGLL